MRYNFPVPVIHVETFKTLITEMLKLHFKKVEHSVYYFAFLVWFDWEIAV